MSFHVPSKAPKPDDVDIPQEATGPVAKDSLAAESIQDDGGFSENQNATAMGVRGDQSTLNTTDTSGATVLPAAVDSEAREKKDFQAQGSDARGVSGLKYPDGVDKVEFSGHHSAQGYVGGPSSSGMSQTGAGGGSGAPAGASDFGASTLSSSSGGPDPSQIRSGGNLSSSSSGGGNTSSSGSAMTAGGGAGVRPYVETAPNYVTSVTGQAVPENTFKPKGSNLDDADLTGSIPQTKTFTGAVGTVNDPGRLAEKNFEGRNDDPIGVEGGREGQQGGETGQFGVLQNERA